MATDDGDAAFGMACYTRDMPMRLGCELPMLLSVRMILEVLLYGFVRAFWQKFVLTIVGMLVECLMRLSCQLPMLLSRQVTFSVLFYGFVGIFWQKFALLIVAMLLECLPQKSWWFLQKNFGGLQRMHGIFRTVSFPIEQGSWGPG
jgi:hypothetical protein